MENRYLRHRLVWYFARISNKRSHWNKLEMRHILLSLLPDVTLSDDGYLIVNSHLDKHLDENDPDWKNIIKALMDEAERLYPEFKGKIIIFDDKNEKEFGFFEEISANEKPTLS